MCVLCIYIYIFIFIFIFIYIHTQRLYIFYMSIFNAAGGTKRISYVLLMAHDDHRMMGYVYMYDDG